MAVLVPDSSFWSCFPQAERAAEEFIARWRGLEDLAVRVPARFQGYANARVHDIASYLLQHLEPEG